MKRPLNTQSKEY